MAPRRACRSSTCRAGSRVRTAPSCWPTAAPTWSRSRTGAAIRCAGSSSAARRPLTGDDGALFRFLSASKRQRGGRGDDAGPRSRPRAGRPTPTSWCGRRELGRRRRARARRVALHDAHPGLVVVALSPFGLDGPVGGPAVDRLHASGVVRRPRATRHARPRPRCCSAVAPGSGRPARTAPSVRWRHCAASARRRR